METVNHSTLYNSFVSSNILLVSATRHHHQVLIIKTVTQNYG